MSDSDSDEKSENIRNGNYKSPSKRKRQKGEIEEIFSFDDVGMRRMGSVEIFPSRPLILIIIFVLLTIMSLPIN